MEENKDFDIESIVDELSLSLEQLIEDTLSEQIESCITCAVQDIIPEVLSESFSEFEFVLKDGTVVRPIQRMKVLSPDKSKLLVCHGGLRVDGSSLMIQTRISCWENIAHYQSREEAVEALLRVRSAMEQGDSIIEL